LAGERANGQPAHTRSAVPLHGELGEAREALAALAEFTVERHR
jgi:hypothetical protein